MSTSSVDNVRAWRLPGALAQNPRWARSARAPRAATMGLWVNTAYVNTGDVDRVARTLADLFHAEGMSPVAPPAPRKRQRIEPMQYEPALGNDLWGVALFPGAPQWTVIQCAPLELLAQRAPGAAQMRLAALSRALQVAAFHFNLYDSTAAVLAEVSSDARVQVSGFDPHARAGDPLRWNGETIAEGDYEAGFRLLPHGDLFAHAAAGDDKAAAIAGRFGGSNARYCDNLVSVATLICHTAFDAPGGQVRYFRWTGPSRQRYAPHD